MKYEPASWNTSIGHCQPGCQALIAYAETWGIGNQGCYNDRPVRGSTSVPSLHREGRAVDLAAAPRTQELVDYLVGNYEALGVQQVIWQQQSWRCDRVGDKWRSYDGVDPHTGHAHVELTTAAAADNTIDTYREHEMASADEIAAAIVNYPVVTRINVSASNPAGQETTLPLGTLLSYWYIEYQRRTSPEPMVFAFHVSDNVIVAVIGSLGLVLIELMRRQNSRQHGASVAELQALRSDVMAELRDIKADVRTMKDDVRETDHKVDTLRAESVRRHEENIVHLEAHDGSLVDIDKHVALVDTAVAELAVEVTDLSGRVSVLEPPGDQ